ncbi:uncharacterized protein LOC110844983 [Folsomia candida]|uniref:Uncharacterized protein n=1 Tax=Folsomia candida TaxID=158441 RepID=A0A226ETI3_FOLCA|nr:uncharacterized protein LOC110844983 [Folsomia candida]XP_035704570.1 uncharacterized protein LOC110844983 [Folsomia candida]OXA60925.1 hypothetical protein Fcan01_04032 [Folsomia candida]
MYDTILRAGLTLLPCTMIGLILIISFLLCNCEYIGECISERFCTWKNRSRKSRIKSKKQSDTSKKRHTSSSHETFKSSPSSNFVRLNEPDIRSDDPMSYSSSNSELAQNHDDNDPPPSYDECIRSKRKK